MQWKPKLFAATMCRRAAALGLACVLSIAFAAANAAAADEANGSSMLIEVDQLAERLGRPNWRIVDARSRAEYLESHIPGAVWVDVADWQDLGRQEGGFQNAAAWGQRVGRLGIGHKSTVVVYGSELPSVARVWWLLKYVGVSRVLILNGGWPAWVRAGRPTESGEVMVPAAEFEPRFQADRLEELPSLVEKISAGIVKLLDTRSRDEYEGKLVRGPRGGHLPGAVHLEWKELVAEDGRFKSREEIRALLRERGILPSDTVVCY